MLPRLPWSHQIVFGLRALLESGDAITQSSLVSIGKEITEGVVAFPLMCDAWCDELLDELDGTHRITMTSLVQADRQIGRLGNFALYTSSVYVCGFQS